MGSVLWREGVGEREREGGGGGQVEEREREREGGGGGGREKASKLVSTIVYIYIPILSGLKMCTSNCGVVDSTL